MEIEGLTSVYCQGKVWATTKMVLEHMGYRPGQTIPPAQLRRCLTLTATVVIAHIRLVQIRGEQVSDLEVLHAAFKKMQEE